MVRTSEHRGLDQLDKLVDLHKQLDCDFQFGTTMHDQSLDLARRQGRTIFVAYLRHAHRLEQVDTARRPQQHCDTMTGKA